MSHKFFFKYFERENTKETVVDILWKRNNFDIIFGIVSVTSTDQIKLIFSKGNTKLFTQSIDNTLFYKILHDNSFFYYRNFDVDIR